MNSGVVRTGSLCGVLVAGVAAGLGLTAVVGGNVTDDPCFGEGRLGRTDPWLQGYRFERNGG